MKSRSNSHPLDNPAFREWYKEQDEEWMAYGIYDSRWAELFDQFLDEQGDNHEKAETTIRRKHLAPA